MRDDFEDLRGFLRTEGIGHGTGLREAEVDPRLAQAGEHALTRVLAERRVRQQRRRLAGGLAVAAVAVVVAVGAGGVLLRPVSPVSPALPASSAPPVVPDPAPAPLLFAAQPTPAGPALEELAEASADASGYLASVPARTAWYTWEASSPQHGRLVVVTADGGRIQVQTVQVRAPEQGQIDVADRVSDPAVTVEHAPTAEDPVVDALHDAAAARCAGAPPGCDGQGSSPLGAPAGLASSAALRALGELPGTRAAGTTTDRLGRPVIGFTAELDADHTILVLADPRTGGFLGAEWIDERAQPRVTRLIVALPDRADGRD